MNFRYLDKESFYILWEKRHIFRRIPNHMWKEIQEGFDMKSRTKSGEYTELYQWYFLYFALISIATSRECWKILYENPKI